MTNLLQPEGLAGCYRCGFVWRPRSGNPHRCARCKSELWDVPRLSAVRKGRGSGPDLVIGSKRAQLLTAVRAHRARNPRVFGSVVRFQATDTSDLDLLVDFDDNASLFDQLALKDELEELLHRRVDVVDPQGLHWLIKPQVLFEAQSV